MYNNEYILTFPIEKIKEFLDIFAKISQNIAGGRGSQYCGTPDT